MAVAQLAGLIQSRPRHLTVPQMQNGRAWNNQEGLGLSRIITTNFATFCITRRDAELALAFGVGARENYNETFCLFDCARGLSNCGR
jgi:hypothetical protein